MSGIARILLDRGAMVEFRFGRQRSRAGSPRCAPGALISIGHARAASTCCPAADGRHHHPPRSRDQPRTRRGPPPRRPGDPAPGGAGLADGGAPDAAGDRRTARPRPLRCSSWPCSTAVLIPPSPSGASGRAGTNAHHGSGDVFVARADRATARCWEYTPRRRSGDQCRADHLDFFGTPQAYTTVFDKFVRRLAPGRALVVSPTTRVRRRWPAAARRWACRCCATAAIRRPDWPAARRWEQRGTGRSRIQLAGEPHQRTMRLSVPGLHGAQRAGRPACRRRGRCAGQGPGRAGRLRGVRRRFGWSARPAACRSSTTTPTTRPRSEGRRSSPCVRSRTARTAGRPAKATWHRGVPAPFVFAHKGFRSGLRRCAGYRRPRLRARRLCGREQPLAGISGASIAEHVTVPVRYLPDFSSVAARVAASRSTGRRGGHHGLPVTSPCSAEIIAALNAAAGAPGRSG